MAGKDNDITGAEALMLSLRDEGVDTIFGYPGGAIMPVFDVLYDYTRGSRKVFNHILVRHEQGAAHAAEGYARVSGRVGVCLVTSGPGATNTLTGVADAMMDSTPIVVIAGQVGTDALGSDAFQEVDLVGVAQPVCKWSYQIRRPEDVAWAVSKAFYIARTGRPGPVVLDFPKNAQLGRTPYQPQHVCHVRSYVAWPRLDMQAVDDAARLIDQARRPMALVGQGVELAGAQPELAAFLEKTGIPAARTMLGLSALPTGHPLNVGMLGMHGNLAPNIKQQECDVLIAIGMRFSDRVTGSVDRYARQAKVIHLEIDAAEINKNVKADVAVVANCKESLKALTGRVRQRSHEAWIESFRPYMQKELRQVVGPAIHPTEGPLLMGEVVNAVAEATHGDAVMVSDVGQNQMFACRYFKYNSKRSVVSSGGLGTMGFGLPAAIGATFGAPQRTVCFFTGDGGLQMSLHELGTVMEQQAPVKIILLNNNYLGNVRQWQDMFFNRRKSFTRMHNPRYSLICQAYGIGYRLVENRADLAGAVSAMLAAPGPYMLECAVKEEDNVMPMVAPGNAIDQMQLSVNERQ